MDMYGLEGGMILGAVVVGIAIFAVGVLLIRWILGIQKMIDLLTAIEANTAPAKATRAEAIAVAEKPAPRPVD